MVTPGNPDEQEILRRARSLRARAYASARQRGLGPADAQDAAEEALLHVLAATDGTLSPPPTVRNPGAWLRRCAEYQVIDYLRHVIPDERRRAASPEPDDHHGPPSGLELPSVDRSPEEAMLLAEAEHAIVAAIDALDTQEHLDFIDALLLDIPIRQLAAETGRTPNAIYKELDRTRERLRRLLEEEGWTEADIRRAFASPAPPVLRVPPRAAAGETTGEENAEAAAKRAAPIRLMR